MVSPQETLEERSVINWAVLIIRVKKYLFALSLFFSQDKSLTMFQHQKNGLQPEPASPTSLSPTVDMQMQYCPDSAPRPLGSANTSVQSPSSGKAERSAIVPTRCLSPNSTPSRHEQMCCRGRVGPGDHSGNENSSVSLARRFLQEVKSEDFLQHKVLVISIIFKFAFWSDSLPTVL